MKNAVLLLAFLLIVLAMLGGPASTTGNVTLVKNEALRTASELNIIDRKVQENNFVIKLKQASGGVPVLVSGSEVSLELDFTFLGDSYFTRLDDYVKTSHLKTYLEIGGKVLESEVAPSGFLKYSCKFRIPEGMNGTAIIGYKTKNWDKNKQVLITQEDKSAINSFLGVLGF